MAGWAVVSRLTVLAFGGLFALSGAIGGIFGQNYGAGRFDRVKRTYRDALVFCVMHEAITSVAPAEQVDPAYAAGMAQAMAEGLEVYLLLSEINLQGIYPQSAHDIGENPSHSTH